LILITKGSVPIGRYLLTVHDRGLPVTRLTGRYGFVAAVAARGVLSGAALPTHDTVVFGAEGLLGQRLVTLRAAETLLVPEPALVTELLVEGGSLMRGNIKRSLWTELTQND